MTITRRIRTYASGNYGYEIKIPKTLRKRKLAISSYLARRYVVCEFRQSLSLVHGAVSHSAHGMIPNPTCSARSTDRVGLPILTRVHLFDFTVLVDEAF
jgi:hypothetical protein